MANGVAVIGQKLGSFLIESRVGTGLTRSLYLAVDEVTGQVVAVNVEAGADAAEQARLLRSGEILRRFRHPNIVRCFATGIHHGTSYIATEYIAGPFLAEVLARRGALPWAEVVGLAGQICDALSCLHRGGVVHRNLKPSNFLLTGEGQVKMIGFGMAIVLDEAAPPTLTGRVLGTPRYMAPEQIRGTPAISPKTDLYALGAVLCEMLTGEPAFGGETPIILMHRHLNDPPPKPGSLVSGIPASLDVLIGRLMAKTPGDRPADAEEVSETLSRVGQCTDDRVEKPSQVWSQMGIWRYLFRLGSKAVGPDQVSPSDELRDKDLDGK